MSDERTLEEQCYGECWAAKERIAELERGHTDFLNLQEVIGILRAEVAALTAERNAANAKLAELSAVCEAAQFLIIRRNKTLDATIKKLQTANERIETLESEVNKQEAEIRDLHYERGMEP
jgi:cell division protein FtsB